MAATAGLSPLAGVVPVPPVPPVTDVAQAATERATAKKRTSIVFMVSSDGSFYHELEFQRAGARGWQGGVEKRAEIEERPARRF
jgi:hypothetical protein